MVSVGTGFTEVDRARLQARLEPLERRTHPFAAAPPRADVARVRWVEPELVGEVVFRTFTSAGRVRHTAWRGLREDRTPAEVTAPGPVPAAPAATPDHASTAAPAEPPVTQAPLAAAIGQKVTVQAGNRRLTLSNLDKQLYPDGFTKGEVINYYSRIADVLLPHLAGPTRHLHSYPDYGSFIISRMVISPALITIRLPHASAAGDRPNPSGRRRVFSGPETARRTRGDAGKVRR